MFVISFIIMSWFSYSYTSNIVEEKTNRGLMQAFGQIDISISSMIMEIENISEQIYMNSILQKIVEDSYGNISHFKQYEDYKEFSNFLNILEQNPNIEKIELYLKNQSVYSQDYKYTFQLDSSRAKFFGKKIKNKQVDKNWCMFDKIPQEISYGPYDWLYSSNSGAIFFIRKIKQLDAISNECGLLVIKINQSKIMDMMKEINITENIEVCLIDNNDVILCRDYKEPFIQVVNNDNINGHEYPDNYRKIKYDNKEYLSFSKKISNIDWYLRGIIPKNELKHEGTKIRNFLIFITVISCILTTIISTVITKSMSMNINIIVRKMENIDTFSTEKEISFRDEIGKLEDHFIKMVYTLKSLIKENYEVKISKNEAEFRALQAQINPHFLYNTLDCINWLALTAKEKSISKAVTHLSRFLRYSLSRDDTAKIRDEVEHIQIYVEIQNIRFDNCINIHYDIPICFFEYTVPRLTFQPLVENSIIHGFKPQMNGQGKINIWIRCQEEAQKLIIYIEDDGIGISEVKLQSVLNEQSWEEIKKGGEMKGSGYGLNNIKERLRLYYGEEYGLEVFNNNGKGACVRLILPLKSRNMEKAP